MKEYDKIVNIIDMNIIVRRCNRKTISLEVLSDRELALKVPLYYTDEELQSFLERHRRWIEKRVEACRTKSVISLENGARLTLFGAEYTIVGGTKAAWRTHEIVLPDEKREEHFRRLLKFRVREEMTELTKSIAAKWGFRYRDVFVSSAKKRWGSCTKEGILRFSFCVAFLPEDLTEYLVVHELGHTRHMDHSREFWAVVEEILPDWRQRRAALRSYEWVLECF